MTAATGTSSKRRIGGVCAALLFGLLVAAACGGESTEGSPTGGAGGTAQAGTGGTAGTAGTAAAGGTAGTSTDASTQDGGLEGTRCDNGIGVGGDGCADNFPWGDEMGFSVDPSHLTTNHGANEPVVVRGASFYTIPDPVLQVLQEHSAIVRFQGSVPVNVDSTWTDSLTWDQHEVLLRLAPTSPLGEGWYVVTISGSLDTGHNTPARIPSSGIDEYKSLFRVGSAPIFVAIDNCVDSVTLTLSELVIVPDPLPLALQSAGTALSCTRELGPGQEPSPVTSLTLRCDGLDSWKDLDIIVSEGLASSSQVPLRNADGDTTFTISMPGVGTGGDCRTWKQTGVPSF